MTLQCLYEKNNEEVYRMTSRVIEPNSEESVTAVIPVYNEQKYIGAVLDSLREVPCLSQIVVIDDGSTDKTTAAVRLKCAHDDRIQLIRLPQNKGKAVAMTLGIKASFNDLLLFLDGDLIGLRPNYINDLITPVRQESCHMALGIFTRGRRQTDLSHKLTPFLSGQRCLRWRHFSLTPGLEQTKWGIETALSFYAWREEYTVRKIFWSGVTHAMRPEKMTGWQGYLSHAQMWLDIIAYLTRYIIWPGLHGASFARSKEQVAELSLRSGDQ
jgi:glycosyltransferase involved in cell wall biosynthesis